MIASLLTPTAATSPAAEPAPDQATAARIDRHLRHVWRYLRMHGAAPQLADDLAQEAFVVALQKGALDFDPAATATFLQRTARFLFLRHLRDRRPAVELADAVDELWQREAAADGGDALVDAVRHCVEKLEGRAREAIRRCYGLDQDDPTRRTAAAHALGLQPNGLKTLLQRTRQVLRACIERSHR